MRAVLCSEYGPPEKLQIVDDPKPLEPGPGQVLVKVAAAGVNFPDVLMIQGKYQFQPPMPFIPGAELAGTVTAVGAGVSHLKIGDRVAAMPRGGAFASEALVDAAVAMPLPPMADLKIAASFVLAYGTSYHALKQRAELKAGETLLVLGASGGVGLAAVEIGKAFGAKVIAAASSEEKLAVCKAQGADLTINYATEDLKEAIKRTTDGKGPDVVYDPVGGSYTEVAVRSMAWRGRYLVIGFANGEIPKLPLNLPLLKGSSIVGVFWGEFVKRQPGDNVTNMEEMMGMLMTGKLKPHISASYPLDKAPEALRAMMERKVTGKVVITME